jgi:hypothetical protein
VKCRRGEIRNAPKSLAEKSFKILRGSEDNIKMDLKKVA